MPKKQESRELELPPDLVEHLISLGPEDAVAYLLDVPDLNLSVAEAEDVVYSLLQEQHLSAELAQELLRRDPIEAIALLLELPLELTPELAAGLVGQLRQDFQEQYLTPEIVAEVLRRQPDEAVRWLLEEQPQLELLPEMAQILVVHVWQDHRPQLPFFLRVVAEVADILFPTKAEYAARRSGRRYRGRGGPRAAAAARALAGRAAPFRRSLRSTRSRFWSSRRAAPASTRRRCAPRTRSSRSSGTRTRTSSPRRARR